MVRDFQVAVARLGGTVVRTGRERGQYYVVMADVDGHEFCVH